MGTGSSLVGFLSFSGGGGFGFFVNAGSSRGSIGGDSQNNKVVLFQFITTTNKSSSLGRAESLRWDTSTIDRSDSSIELRIATDFRVLSRKQ